MPGRSVPEGAALRRQVVRQLNAGAPPARLSDGEQLALPGLLRRAAG